MTQNSDVAHPLHPLIEKRWSPRSFLDKELPKEAIRSIFEAARWAPSCFNEQPWSFIVALKKETDSFQTMLGGLVDANRIWAEHAPLLAIAIAKNTFSRNDSANRHAMHDVGLAVGQMGIQAMSLGIYLHQMAGILPDALRQTYQLPDHCDPVTAIAMGYPGPPNQLPEALAQRELAPRMRKAQDQFVFATRWNQPF